MDKCKVFEQARRFISALRYGYPTAASEFKDNTKRLALSEITDCIEECKKEHWDYPSCCSVAFLKCGDDLILGDVTSDFEVILRPNHGQINTEDGVRYVPFTGFLGQDEFTYMSNGQRINVCVTVSSFTAEAVVTPISEGLVKREIITDCDSTVYLWHDGSNSSYNYLGPNEQWDVMVECDGCVKYFTECITCGADVPMLNGVETVTDIVGFDGERDLLNKASSLITADLQTAHNDRYEDCGVPVVSLEQTDVYRYTIEDTPPFVEHIVINQPGAEFFGGWDATVGLKYWLGGDCYNVSTYVVSFSFRVNRVYSMVLGQDEIESGDLTNDNISAATTANELKAFIENQGYAVDSVQVSTEFNNYKVKIIGTNAPLGRVIMTGSAGAEVFSFEKE